MQKISLAKFKKVEGKTSQDKMITNDQQQKLKELIEQRNKTIRELKEIAQEYLEEIEKDSDDNGGAGGLPSELSIKIVITIATAAISYFSQKEEEESKDLFSRLSELVAQYFADPSEAVIKKIRELVLKATKIKETETGKGFADLISKSGIDVIAGIAKSTHAKASLSDTLERLQKILPKDSKTMRVK